MAQTGASDGTSDDPPFISEAPTPLKDGELWDVLLHVVHNPKSFKAKSIVAGSKYRG